MKNLNIVLDLDNTLIYSYDYPVYQKLKEKKWLKSFTAYEMDKDYVVCERPRLQMFLRWLFKNFNVMVWSAASPDYVNFIVNNIVAPPSSGRKLDHIFNSTHCEESYLKYDGDTKNLNLLWDTYDFKGYGPYNTLIIDDMKHVIDSQPNHAIRIKKFIADEKRLDDDGLSLIKEKLREIKYKFDTTKNKGIDYKII